MVENGKKFGETKNHPIYEYKRLVAQAVHVDILGVSKKYKTGSLCSTYRQISAEEIFFSQSFKISLKITKSPTTK
mgnify:CR=1 FL=1